MDVANEREGQKDDSKAAGKSVSICLPVQIHYGDLVHSTPESSCTVIDSVLRNAVFPSNAGR
jgi:hypothetical protein